jgi:hypothetical protein
MTDAFAQPDELFLSVRSTGLAPNDIVVLQGWVGSPDEASAVRLYLRVDGTEYVDIDPTKIIHSEKLPIGQGTLIWIHKDEELRRTFEGSQGISAEYLSGTIADECSCSEGAWPVSWPCGPGYPFARPVAMATLRCWPK